MELNPVSAALKMFDRLVTAFERIADALSEEYEFVEDDEEGEG